DSEERPLGRRSGTNRRLEPCRAQVVHAVRKRTDAREHDGIRRVDFGRRGGYAHVCTDLLERLRDAAQIAYAIVDDCDHFRRFSFILSSDYSEPLVDGTPSVRASSAQAMRNAFANALNVASMMWCGFLP